MNKSDEGVERLWPEFPALIVQDWLELELGTTVYYHFSKFLSIRVVFAMKIKSPGNKVVKIEERAWPDWPIAAVQEFLELNSKSMVEYVPMGSQNKIGAVGITPNKLDEDVQLEVEDFLSNVTR
ncbi:MAG: hypothetical protein C4583_06345 [Anaerolineaceae bacterium]|nr:MAG: hypothetical protein C4583_06345 [Anaerolineaceae bacterium]